MGALMTCQAGSPPLTRGKVEKRVSIIVKTGITPAYAGKRSNRRLTHGRAWDHPRLRGEKTEFIAKGAATARITPAYARKRKGRMKKSSSLRDHPRLRGEKFFSAPPLPRGIYKLLSPYRITSAAAEKALRARCRRRQGAPLPVTSGHFYYTCSIAETQFPFSREFSRDFP